VTVAETAVALVPVSSSSRDRLAEHAATLRLAGQLVVAEILEGIVAAFDEAEALPEGALSSRNGGPRP
jgi:hypothetical protein